MEKDSKKEVQAAAQFVHLEGPPGTGKTVTLLIRILTWLDEGHVVWLVSLSPKSRSVTHNLYEQAKNMLQYMRFVNLKEEEQLDYQHRLRMFMMNRPPETCKEDYFKHRLLMFRDKAMTLCQEREQSGCQEREQSGCQEREQSGCHEREQKGKVCVVMDETLTDFTAEECELHRSFFEWVSKLYLEDKQGKSPVNFTRGLSVWSAALHRKGRPAYAVPLKKQTPEKGEKFGLLWVLDFPMRCPPCIQRALMCVQGSLEEEHVCCFKKEKSVAHFADQSQRCTESTAGTLNNPPNAQNNPGDQSQRCTESTTGTLNNPPTTPNNPGDQKKQSSTARPNHYVTDGVPVKLIGHGSHSRKAESVWDCKECGTELAQYLNTNLQIGRRPVPTELRKLEHPSDQFLPLTSVLIVPTRRAQKYRTLNSSFSQIMAEQNLEIALNAPREEGDAPMPNFSKDVIMVSDMTSIHGLERAVVIIIPDVKTDDGVNESAAGNGQAAAEALSDEAQYHAAFDPLHIDCRKDLFYIGSRAVCKLIVFHSGKDLADTQGASPSEAVGSERGKHEEQPMET